MWTYTQTYIHIVFIQIQYEFNIIGAILFGNIKYIYNIDYLCYYRPILVINGDILTESDFDELSQFHDATSSHLTIGAINYHVKVPFGVIHNEAERVIKLVEKPSQNYLCNAGIYLVSPLALQIVPKDTYFNMTNLVDLCLAQSKAVSVFPIHEYWSDVGTPEDLDKARALFSKIEI